MFLAVQFSPIISKTAKKLLLTSTPFFLFSLLQIRSM